MKFAAVALLGLALLWPATASAAWDVGPPIGAKVPSIHATNLAGQPVKLRDMAGKKGTVLVFFRSAKWCPYCQAQLLALKDAPEPLATRGYKLAAISYDPTDVLSRFGDQRQITYPLLSDVGSVTIDAWKLRDLRYKSGTYAWGVPYASIYVIGADGTLKAKLAEEDYKTRPPLSAILAAIDALRP